jgi:hypothetical protein
VLLPLECSHSIRVAPEPLGHCAPSGVERSILGERQQRL